MTIIISPENVATFRRKFDELTLTTLTTDQAIEQALTAVADEIDAEQVAPIEQALAESERDVAELGRKLHIAMHMGER